jgi:hypothetical protein
MANATYFKNGTGAASRYLTTCNEGRTAFTYHPERCNTRATSGVQIAKSVYSGFTASVGGNSMPAPTVALVPCSIKMNEPVSRLVL